MNTEIIEYFKKLSKKEYFIINLINSALGIFILVLGTIGLMDKMTMISYALMFLAGAVMLFLNFYKGSKKKNRNRYVFLAAGIIFTVFSGMFFYAML